MRVIEGENELRLTCSRSVSGGIALLRCETQDDIVRLPDEIDGVPVTEVGAYVLSERAPDLTGKDTFAVRITCGGTEPKHNAAAIRTVTLPKDAKSVGSYAFYNCRNLERIELTDSVSEFGGLPYRLCSRMPQKRSILRFCAHTAAIWRSPAPRQVRPLP